MHTNVSAIGRVLEIPRHATSHRAGNFERFSVVEARLTLRLVRWPEAFIMAFIHAASWIFAVHLIIERIG